MSGAPIKRWQRVALSKPLEFVLPTVTTLYFNQHHLSSKLKTVDLPPKAWAQQEAKELLARSEDRLRNLEAKGPGLAAVAAIVAAGVVAAIIDEGGNATWQGKILLGVAAWYAIWSLVVPIYLVGPQARETIDLNHLISAANRKDPEQYLAVQAQQAAQGNVRRTQRIGNLQDAARKELSIALGVLTVWLLLGPAIGLLKDGESPTKTRPMTPRTTSTSTTTALPAPTISSPTSTIQQPTTTEPRRRPRTTATTPSTDGARAPSETPWVPGEAQSADRAAPPRACADGGQCLHGVALAGASTGVREHPLRGDRGHDRPADGQLAARCASRWVLRRKSAYEVGGRLQMTASVESANSA